MTFDDFLKFTQGVGVPTAIAFFILWRLDQTLRDIRDELKQLRGDLLGRDVRDQRPKGTP